MAILEIYPGHVYMVASHKTN